MLVNEQIKLQFLSIKQNDNFQEKSITMSQKRDE